MVCADNRTISCNYCRGPRDIDGPGGCDQRALRASTSTSRVLGWTASLACSRAPRSFSQVSPKGEFGTGPRLGALWKGGETKNVPQQVSLLHIKIVSRRCGVICLSGRGSPQVPATRSQRCTGSFPVPLQASSLCALVHTDR